MHSVKGFFALRLIHQRPIVAMIGDASHGRGWAFSLGIYYRLSSSVDNRWITGGSCVRYFVSSFFVSRPTHKRVQAGFADHNTSKHMFQVTYIAFPLGRAQKLWRHRYSGFALSLLNLCITCVLLQLYLLGVTSASPRRWNGHTL